MKFSDWLGQKNENWYGTYCGPGPKISQPDCSKLADGSDLPKPFDPLDAACKQHDINYCKAGKDWKAAVPLSLFRSPETLAADSDFAKNIKNLMKNKSLTPYAHGLARLILWYFRHRDTDLA